MRRSLTALAAFILFGGVAGAAPEAGPPSGGASPVVIAVTAASGLGPTNSGRLIVFVQKLGDANKGSDKVDTSDDDITGTSVIAREVRDLKPGRIALLGGETDAFPGPLSKLPSGKYRFQAVLDRNHDYNYSGRSPGDLVSQVVVADLPGPMPILTLDHEVKAATDEARLDRMAPDKRKAMQDALAGLRPVDIQSAKLTAFWGTPTSIRGWVALPPGYDRGTARYPTVYTDAGFTSTLASARYGAASMSVLMQQGDVPPMIWVFLDHHLASGTHEFADSVNNGPWGTALVSEAIPALEKQYRMDGKPGGRFTMGHSSGGWSALWLQVAYPKTFGGAWPISPDPADFHDFTNADLYAPGANMYHDAAGARTPLVRDKGKVLATLQQFAQLEAVLGPYGGQYASFDWVFSPRCPDGRPCPMFNRASGNVDPAVVAYWREHYDIAHIIERDWGRLKPDLDGKIHLTVGTADTYYLDGPAHRLKAVMDRLGARADFTFLADKTHYDLFIKDKDGNWLTRQIAAQIYAVARPARKQSLQLDLK